MAKTKNRKRNPTAVACLHLAKVCRRCEHEFVETSDVIVCPECGERRFCGRPAVAGSDRCVRHTQKAVHDPNRKHSHIPRAIFDEFLAAYNNPDILSCQEDLAIITVRLRALLSKINLKESQGWRKRLYKAWSEFRKHYAAGNAAKFAQALEELGRTIESGHKEDELWREIFDTIQVRTSVANREVEYRKNMKESMTIEQMAILLTNVTNAVNEEVTDSRVKSRIAERLRGIYAPKMFQQIAEHAAAEQQLLTSDILEY